MILASRLLLRRIVLGFAFAGCVPSGFAFSVETIESELQNVSMTRADAETDPATRALGQSNTQAACYGANPNPSMCLFARSTYELVNADCEAGADTAQGGPGVDYWQSERQRLTRDREVSQERERRLQERRDAETQRQNAIAEDNRCQVQTTTRST